MVKLKLHWQILIALFLGVIVGALFGERIIWISFLGDIFLRLLKMIIIPLIIASIISGVTSVGSAKKLGKLGAKTFIYYISTSLLAIITGLILVNIVQPGVGADLGLEEAPTGLSTIDSPVDILYRLIPVNPVASMADGEILPIIFFCIFFGFFVTRLPESSRIRVTQLFETFFEIMMKMTGVIIRLAPIGVFGLMVKIVAKTGFSAFVPLLSYMSVVAGGLLIHALITLPLVLALVAKVNPLEFFRNMSDALTTAFSTSSSSATLPLTITSVQKKAGVSNKITSFVLPLGSTINMDGTALYECVAAIFIAQAYGIDLSFTQQLIVVMTALLASIGAAGIPMAGLVMMSIILNAVGLPLEGVGLIIAVDRVLDMMRTTVNVWSDSVGTITIAKSEGEKVMVSSSE
ncbi:MAG: dicarboxylate/amino acid:cation symporter [Candidatus Marinimicrobia bacterium]|nr:dicarboxylate/amino acid:cation symporter [Candidatus Neomarinimicrobiota bacterium]